MQDAVLTVFDGLIWINCLWQQKKTPAVLQLRGNFLSFQIAAVFGHFQGSAVESSHHILQVQGILHACGLVAGVHGQLGQADVHGGDGHVRQGNMAQRGAATRRNAGFGIKNNRNPDQRGGVAGKRS